MKKDNLIRQKSFEFALRIIKLCLWLRKKNHYELSSQLLRSGTSVGANIEEALAAQSRKDFLNKITIASKEARETNYWLRLLCGSEILTEHQSQAILSESEELVKILTSIAKTTKLNHHE